MSDSYFVAVHSYCGHTRAVWIVDLTDPIDAMDHAKQLKSCLRRGLVVVEVETREQAIDGLGRQCDVCRNMRQHPA